MPERLKKRAMRVVGVRQTLRAVKEQDADMVFVAMDADPRLRQQVEKEAEANAVERFGRAQADGADALTRVGQPARQLEPLIFRRKIRRKISGRLRARLAVFVAAAKQHREYGKKDT